MLNCVNNRNYYAIKKKGIPTYEVNTKTARKMIHYALSVTEVKKYMKMLQINSVNLIMKNRTNCRKYC